MGPLTICRIYSSPPQYPHLSTNLQCQNCLHVLPSIMRDSLRQPLIYLFYSQRQRQILPVCILSIVYHGDYLRWLPDMARYSNYHLRSRRYTFLRLLLHITFASPILLSNTWYSTLVSFLGVFGLYPIVAFFHAQIWYHKAEEGSILHLFYIY